MNPIEEEKNGAAMGSRPVPHYANIFMSKIDKKVEALA